MEKNTSHVNKKKIPTNEIIPSLADQLKAAMGKDYKLVSLAEAQKLKENYLALLKKLEYQTKKRELIPADSVKKAMADLVLSARSKILALKGKLAPLLKEFVEDPEQFGIVMNSVENTIRDTLTEMADSEKQ